MPAAQVIDLSPTPNLGGQAFGEGFGNRFTSKYLDREDDDLLSGINYTDETDPIKQMELLEKRKISPERKKKERDFLLQKAEALRSKAYTDRQIGSSNAKDIREYVNATYGQRYKNTANALKEYIKAGAFDPATLQQLQQAANDAYQDYNSSLRKYAPEGFYDEADSPQEEALEQPMSVQQQGEPSTSSNLLQPEKRESITPENYPRYAAAARQEGGDDKQTTKEIIRQITDQAFPDAVPAQRERLIREGLLGKELPPKPEEIKQLKEKDDKQKKKQKELEKEIPWLEKHIANFSNPQREKANLTPEKAIYEIMRIKNVSEEQAISDFLSSLEFEFVSEEDQQSLYDYWENWADSELNAVSATVQELQRLNHQRWRTPQDEEFERVRKSKGFR